MISCLCPTFGRCPDYQHLLEEAIESYSRQDRPANCELVVLNDCLEQELVLDAPIDGIRIVNEPRRLPSLGEKFNRLVELARGDLLLPWEDDDISLPGRIRQAIEMLADADYWKPPQVWYLENGRPPLWKHSVGVRHHASVFTRVAWSTVGGYPAISGAQDAAMDSRLMGLRHHIENFPGGIPPEHWQYIYRWGVSPNHLSGNFNHDAAYRSEAAKARRAGRFFLKPHWRQDYTSLVRV